jgi:hypothetical protein
MPLPVKDKYILWHIPGGVKNGIEMTKVCTVIIFVIVDVQSALLVYE